MQEQAVRFTIASLVRVKINQMAIYNDSTNSTNDDLKATEESGYCDDYKDIDFLLRSIWMHAGYPVLALGTVGHSLVIVLLLLNKRMRSLPLSVLLLTMSASGLMALYVGLLPTIVTHHTCHNVRLEDETTEFGCQLFSAAIYFSLQLYSWMEVSVAVERMCAVRWALAYRTLSTKSVNTIAITCIITVLIAVNGIHFKIFGMSRRTCEIEDKKLFDAWQYIHTVIYIIFPVAMMLPANALTLHTMYRSPLKNSNNVKRAKPVTIMMFILNGIFFVTTAPILVGNYEHLEESEYEAVRIAWAVTRLIMYLGCSLTFFVYVVVAATFRKALSKLFDSRNKRIRSALVAISNISASQGKRSGGDRASASDQTTNVQLATSSTKSTTDGSV